MKEKKALRNQMVEHLSRLGDASIHQIGDSNDEFAQIYHYHNTLEVIVVQQGWLDGLVDGMLGKMMKGMMLVLGDDVPHCVLRASEDAKVLLVHVPSELLRWDEERFPELVHGIAYIRKSKSGMVYHDERLANEVTRLAGKIAATDGFLRISLMMRLLHVLSTTPPKATLLADRPSGNARNEKESSIDRAYRYLYKHFLENFSLDDLAAHAGIHPSALCRSFKKSSGCTIWQFCRRLRIEHACKLLLTTHLAVNQVAYMSGYNSYPHFCTQFKNAMRMSPTEYRGEKSPSQ